MLPIHPLYNASPKTLLKRFFNYGQAELYHTGKKWRPDHTDG